MDYPLIRLEHRGDGEVIGFDSEGAEVAAWSRDELIEALRDGTQTYCILSTEDDDFAVLTAAVAFFIIDLSPREPRQ